MIVFSVEVPNYIVTDPQVVTYTAGTARGEVETAVPWDPVALNRWEEFIRALSDTPVVDSSQSGAPLVRLADHPSLA